MKFDNEELKEIYSLVLVAEAIARGNAQRKVRKNSWTEEDAKDNLKRHNLLTKIKTKLQTEDV